MQPPALIRPSEILTTPTSYGTRPNGADTFHSMTLREMDAYIRRNMPAQNAAVGLPTFDGMMTALIVDPTPCRPLDIIRVLLAASPAPDDETNPAFLNFCGAIYARYIEITHTIIKSPKPFYPMMTYEDTALVPSYPHAYKPILATDAAATPQPVLWAIGFHNVVRERPDTWHPLIKDHPRYLELGHIYYFVPNRRGYPTNKRVRNHSDVAVHRYAHPGIAADVIRAWHHFRSSESKPCTPSTPG